MPRWLRILLLRGHSRLARRPLRRLLAHSHHGQDLVEYGLIVAAVAFVGLVGLNAIGKAESTVLSTTTLSPPSPAPGFFYHPTVTTLNCDPPPSPQTDFLVLDQLKNCVATVTDSNSGSRSAPNGTVDLRISPSNAIIATCTSLVTGSVSSTCTVTTAYTWQESDVGSHTLVAYYQATGSSATDHQPSHSNPPWGPANVEIRLAPKTPFSCTNPWTGQSNRAQIGQPLICGLTLEDAATHLAPTNPVSVTLNASNAGGYPYFSCFTNNRYGPASLTGTVTNPGCRPNQGLSPSNAIWSCATLGALADPTGTCFSQGLGQFEYRRTLDDNGNPTGFPLLNDFISASVPNQSFPLTITIDAPVQHGTGTTVNCDSNSHISPGPPVGPPPTNNTGDVRTSPLITLLSVVNLLSNAGFDATCEATVLDLGANALFDSSPPQTSGCVAADTRACVIDNTDTHPPLGYVHFRITDTTTALVVPQPCIVGVAYLDSDCAPRCNLVPVHTLLSYSPDPPVGQIRFASYCRATWHVPPGSHWTVDTFFEGGMAHLQSQDPLSFPGPSLKIDVS